MWPPDHLPMYLHTVTHVVGSATRWCAVGMARPRASSRPPRPDPSTPARPPPLQVPASLSRSTSSLALDLPSRGFRDDLPAGLERQRRAPMRAHQHRPTTLTSPTDSRTTLSLLANPRGGRAGLAALRSSHEGRPTGRRSCRGARATAGEIDAFGLDDLIQHYKRSALELWKFCGSSGSDWERAASALAYCQEQGDEPDWWQAGATRVRRG